jgi:hemerythrin superfamily protein
MRAVGGAARRTVAEGRCTTTGATVMRHIGWPHSAGIRRRNRYAPCHNLMETRVEKAKRKTASPEALQMLMQDHRNVQKLFKSFEQMKEDGDADEDSKREIVEQACMELTVHAQLEEECFYPALREALDEEDLVDEALVEHASAKELIAKLQNMQPDDPLYEASFTVLGEYVNHHIKEEEKEIFPSINKRKMDLDALAVEMQQRKQELMQEHGMQAADEEGEGETASAREAEEDSEEDMETAQPQGARRSKRSTAHK